MSELIDASAKALAMAIRDKKVSSEEVIDAHLRRIEAINPKINAVVQLTADVARQQARKADDLVASGDVRGPLHGVPFTVKDWIETAGVVCAADYEERAEFVPKRDATVVARMRDAGAIMLGKTNVQESNPVYGETYNPYDLSRTPGYSSSGEAAIIAAGGSPVGLGSDSGGSIRLPVHCCGIAGLKPSAGLVPNTGHFPRIGAMSDPRTQIGPLARFVEDLALTLPVISGVDWLDAGVIPMPLGDPNAVDIKGLRVAFYTDDEGASPTPETIAVVKAARVVLADAGAVVNEARPQRLEEAREITLAYWRRPSSSLSWRSWMPDRVGEMTGDEVERSLFEWDRFRRAVLSFMESYDLILTPASNRPADPHGTRDAFDTVYTLPYSLTGYPCVVVRAGTSAKGLPIGVQVVARPWRDDVALAVAQHIETALGGWKRPPI